jgi:hypothetical protein
MGHNQQLHAYGMQSAKRRSDRWAAFVTFLRSSPLNKRSEVSLVALFGKNTFSKIKVDSDAFSRIIADFSKHGMTYFLSSALTLSSSKPILF